MGKRNCRKQKKASHKTADDLGNEDSQLGGWPKGRVRAGDGLAGETLAVRCKLASFLTQFFLLRALFASLLPLLQPFRAPLQGFLFLFRLLLLAL